MLSVDITRNPRIKRLREIARLTDAEIRTLAQKLDIEFRRISRRQFSTQGAEGGRRWAELSPSYRQWKRRVAPGRKILALSGRLRNSLTRKGGEHIVRWKRSPLSIELGTKVPYAAAHQRGSTKLPRREPIRLTRAHRIKLGKIVERELNKKLQRIARVIGRRQARRGFR